MEDASQVVSRGLPVNNLLITCLILDSNYHNHLAYLTEDEKKKQQAWMESELTKPRAAWTLALGIIRCTAMARMEIQPN